MTLDAKDFHARRGVAHDDDRRGLARRDLLARRIEIELHHQRPRRRSSIARAAIFACAAGGSTSHQAS